MGKVAEFKKLSTDTLTKEFWRSNERFADLFNSLVYKKEQVKPLELEEMDSDLSSLIADKDLMEAIKRVRDLVKIASDGTRYQLLAIENQQDIHYGMVFRCLFYDVLTYYQQFKKISEKNKKEKLLKTSSEFLSGFRKNDHLIPCRTIVIYYGEKEWDGTQNLSELMKFACEEDREAFNDYHFELICLNKLNVSDYTFKNKDVKDFLLWVSAFYQNGGKRLSEELSDVGLEAAYTAAAVTGTLDLYGKIINESIKHGEETVNMCEAVRKVLEEERLEGKIEGKIECKIEGKLEGKIEGKIEGKLEGELKKAQKIALKMLQAGKPLVEISEFTDLTEKEIQALKSEN